MMQDKSAYIDSIVESLQGNPYYARHFDYKGKKTFLYLDLSNLLCLAHDYSVWIDIEDVVYILDAIYDLKGHYAFTSCNLTNGMVNFLYNAGFIVFQSPFDSDALMGYTICNVSRETDVTLVVIGTHDGGFRGVSDSLAQKGIQVAFLGFKEMFSSFLKSNLLFCLEDMNVLSPLKGPEKENKSTIVTDLQNGSKYTEAAE